MEGMINRTVYTINPNFRLQSNHLLVEHTILLGEDFKLQKDRMDTMMGIFYNYSEFLLK